MPFFKDFSQKFWKNSNFTPNLWDPSKPPWSLQNPGISHPSLPDSSLCNMNA